MLALRPAFHVHVSSIQVPDRCKKTREFFEGLRVCTHLPVIAFEGQSYTHLPEIAFE